MLRSFSTAASLMALLATAATAPLAQAGDLCALPTASLEAAVSQYADSAFAIEEVKKHAIATWYTDRMSVEASQQMVRDITKHCDDDSRMTLVVYGLPNKDCDAGYSTGGFNHNVDDYKKWLQTLADGVGQRKVLYVLEPDAVGLLAKGGCGVTNGYEANVKMALEMLTQNPNADVYLDVGYWTLFSESDASGVAKTVKTLAQAGRLKGISLNTSNYRSNKQISELCGNFQKAYGDNSLHCIVDTSRNYNENPPSSEWCNAKFGGVGRPPSSTTGFDNLDYFIWIKPAGESDGSCEGGDHTSDAMKGPDAGSFFKDHFVELWNNGYFVKEKNMPAIDGSVRPTSAPVSQSPVQTTPAPVVSQSPDATTWTPAPQDGNAGQYPVKPRTESREIDDPASTPAPTRKRRSKKCKSDLADGEADIPAGAVKPASDAPMPNISSKSISFAALDSDGRTAPEAQASGIAADQATTQATAPVLPVGAIAAIVVAGVMAIAIAGVALRRRLQHRSEDPTRPTVDTFRDISVTPAGITVL